MTSNQLIEHLIIAGVLQSPRIIEAFRAVDRNDFVPEEYAEEAYEDYPVPIGYGQTISQPYTVAFMLELLQPASGDKILDVGSGSGWTTVLLAQIVGPSGHVIGVEVKPELVEYGGQNLAKYDFAHATIRSASSKIGAPDEAPFDCILVSAAGTEVPHELVAQLKTGGTMVVPVESAILKIRKDRNGKTHTETYEGFAFVPLIT